ncbi:MAG: hypothetical protein HY720_26810 [Planctomycetes bacterium]|nr:hypothetical protein [Planctomycetota bacterium]
MMRSDRRRVPLAFRWLFWEVDFDRLDVRRDANFILARVLEFGRMREVRWLVATYGYDRIRRFLRDVGHPEISDRTTQFWRAVLRAGRERWAGPPAWPRGNASRWSG